MKAIILANEIGEKLWPLTTPDKPKALLPLYSENTMLEETLRRTLPLCEYIGRNIYIISTAGACREIKKLKIHTNFKIPAANIISLNEKDSIDDYINLLYKIISLFGSSIDDNEVLALIPADQFFWPEEGFIFHMSNIIPTVEQYPDSIYILAMQPGTSAVNMNYINADWSSMSSIGIMYPISDGRDTLSTPMVIPTEYRVTPDLSTAVTLVEEGWLWDLKTIVATLGSLKKYIIGDSLLNTFSTLIGKNQLKVAVATKVVWSILDSWPSIKYLTHDASLFSPPEDKNIHTIESSGNLVKKKPEKEVILVGVDDLVIIDTDDKLLIGTPGALYEHF